MTEAPPLSERRLLDRVRGENTGHAAQGRANVIDRRPQRRRLVAELAVVVIEVRVVNGDAPEVVVVEAERAPIIFPTRAA